MTLRATRYVCVYCRRVIEGNTMIGAGDGSGQDFAHPYCYRARHPPTAPARLMSLSSAGHRERSWVAELYKRGEFPRKWTIADVLVRAKYDPSRDQIAIDINGTPVCWRVERP